ncbi:MAG: polymer-forming cytoskeletal protein [Candidatus Acidiferrales bacterium]|jgi:cytoskeletal protein CcmA (bactofilin family)
MVLSWFKGDAKDSGEWTGFLEQGVKFEGRLETTGTFRVDAQMKGTLVSSETLILGENSQMEGDIEGHLVIVAGQFDGTIRAASKVEIQPKAVVSGEIYTSCLIIEPGALFEGRCHMISSSTHDASRAPVAIPIRSVVARATTQQS